MTLHEIYRTNHSGGGGGPSPIGAVLGVAWFGVDSAKVAAPKGMKETYFVIEF